MVVVELILLVVVVICAILLYGFDKIIVDVEDGLFVTNEQTESSTEVQTVIQTDDDGNTVVVNIDTDETAASSDSGDIEDDGESYSVSFTDRTRRLLSSVWTEEARLRAIVREATATLSYLFPLTMRPVRYACHQYTETAS